MSSNTIINGDVNSPLTFSSPITTTIESGLLTINSNIVSPNTITCNTTIDSSSDSGNLIFNANTIMIKDGIYSTNTNTSSSYSGNINVNANTIIIGNTIGNAQVNGDLAIQNNINSLSNNTVTINANLKVVGNITTQLSINNNLLVSGDVNISGGINFNDNTRQTTAFKTLSPDPSNTYINPSSLIINDKGQVTSATAGTALVPGSYTNTSITVGTNGQISLIGNGASSGGGSGSGGSGPITIYCNAPLPYQIPDNLGSDVILYINVTSGSPNGAVDNTVTLPNAPTIGILKLILVNIYSTDVVVTLKGPQDQYYPGQYIRWGATQKPVFQLVNSTTLYLSDQLNFNVRPYNAAKLWALYAQTSRPLFNLRPENNFYYWTLDETQVGYNKTFSTLYQVDYTWFTETVSGSYNFSDVYLYRKTNFGEPEIFYITRGIWNISWEFRIIDRSNRINKNCNAFMGISAGGIEGYFTQYEGYVNGASLQYQDGGVPPGSYYMGNYNAAPLNNPGSADTRSVYSGNFVATSQDRTDFKPFIAFGNQARFGSITIINRCITIRIG